MQILKIQDLEEGVLTGSLLHRSGKVLFKTGYLLTADDIELLNVAEVKTLALEDANSQTDLIERAALRMFVGYNSYSIATLKEGSVLKKTAMTEEGVTLIEGGEKIAVGSVAGMVKRGITHYYIKRNSSDKRGDVNSFSKFNTLLTKALEKKKATEPPSLKLEIKIDEKRFVSGVGISSNDKISELALSETTVSLNGISFSEALQKRDPLVARSEEIKNEFIKVHEVRVQKTKQLFDDIAKGLRVGSELVEEVVNEIMNNLITDNMLLINLLNKEYDQGDYLFTHALNVTALALTIGAEMGYSQEQLFELGNGALLADVGMLQIPPQILFKEGELTNAERRQIDEHPWESLKILERLPRLPKSTALIAYQSHQFLDDTGYPRRPKGAPVHDFSKIVTLCDIYDSLVTKRPYRHALTPYHAMEAVLKMCSRKKICPTVLEAFLKSISVFPLGSMVQLSDGSIAKVTAVTDQITKPVVSVIYKADTSLLDDEIIRCDLTSNSDLKVTKGLARPDSDSMMKGF